MYMTMTIMRPGLFFQREGPGSEPGNSLLCPDEAPRSACRVLGVDQCRASLLHKQHTQSPVCVPATSQKLQSSSSFRISPQQLYCRSKMRQIESYCQFRDLAVIVRDEQLSAGTAYDPATVKPLSWANIASVV